MQDYINTGITFKGKFNNKNLVFKGKRPENNIEFEVKIDASSIFDTKLICDPKELINIIDWLEGPYKDSGEAYVQLRKIPKNKSKENRSFLDKFLPGFVDYSYNEHSKNEKDFKLRVLPKNFDPNILPYGWKVILDKLSNKGFFNKGKKLHQKKNYFIFLGLTLLSFFMKKGRIPKKNMHGYV